jgi:sugar/nucleoside kinase (ribokinase family)
MTLVDRPTQEALLQQFKGQQKAIELGGSSLNAIRALALLDNRTAFAGMISDDTFGQKIRQRMEELRIKGHIYSSETEATGTCMVFVTPDGERTMATYLGASRLYNKTHIPRQDIADSKVFHFCGYQWDTEGQKEGILAAVEEAKKADTLVSFDLADPFVVQHHKDKFAALLKQADVIFANREEAKLLYGLTPEETAEKLAEHGAIAVIKLGAEGALIRQENHVVKVQPVATKVVDTTAAGDMFAAGFLHGLTSQRPLDECGRIAATLASDVISRYGATLSSQIINDIKRLYP